MLASNAQEQSTPLQKLCQNFWYLAKVMLNMLPLITVMSHISVSPTHMNTPARR